MEKYYLATLNAVPLIGNKTAQKLVEIFGSAENVWRAELPLFQQAGVNQRIVDSFTEFRSKFPDAVEKLVEFCRVKKVEICTLYDENYPPILKEINSAPVVFYYRGELLPNVQRIGIVGTREPTNYGEKVARMLGAELAAAGFTIVSGAAKGIDTFAHEAALKTGRTVAVLGYGINKIPFDRRKLFEKMIDNGGLIMSEFPPNLDGDKGTFPARNRVIAGLVRGVVIVEAGKRSGALITAGFAADSSRDVFVVPNSIFADKSVGCHNLIKDGAFLITGSEDILDFYNIENKKAEQKAEQKVEQKIELEGDEKIIYDAIPTDDFITLDEILMEVDIAPNEISEIILKLELKNLIVENDDRYSRC